MDSVLPVVATTMLRLKRKQQETLSQAFRELANLAAGALVLGQFVGPSVPSPRILLAGFVVWMILILFSVGLAGD